LQANSQAAKTKYDSLSGSSSVEETAGVVGPSFKLYRNRPNPANASTRIGFAMDRSGKATIRVFDAQGRLVRTLADGPRSAGVHEVTWDGRDDLGKEMASGVYFYELSVDGQLVRSRKMHLLR
jgi:flagellar hook assembly protein FlgD